MTLKRNFSFSEFEIESNLHLGWIESEFWMWMNNNHSCHTSQHTHIMKQAKTCYIDTVTLDLNLILNYCSITVFLDNIRLILSTIWVLRFIPIPQIKKSTVFRERVILRENFSFFTEISTTKMPWIRPVIFTHSVVVMNHFVRMSK